MTDSNLPLALYKANLDLWLRLGELLQDNREQWMQLLAREVHDSVVEARAETEQAQQAEGWQSLSMLPGSALWRIAQQQMGDLQALMQTAVGNQMTFANGFHNALAEWQEATAGAIGGAAEVAPVGDLLERTLQTISALAPGAAGMAGAPSRAPAARQAGSADASPGTTARGGTPVRKRSAGAAAKTVKKTAKRATGKAASPGKPAAKAGKKTAKKATRKPAKKTARKTAKPATRKVAKRRPAKKAAK